MEQTFSVNGVVVFTANKNNKVQIIQFLPDDEFTPILEQSAQSSGQLQVLRNGAFDFISNKPRVRANSELIRKSAHGRLSGTRDHAFQLTLKVFASEGIDWQKAFVEEPIEVMADLMGPQRIRQILKEALKKLEAQGQVGKSWKPFGMEW